MGTSDAVQVAMITSMASVLVGVLGTVAALLSRGEARRARHQVENNHVPNLRDDLDEKFLRLERRLDGIVNRLNQNDEHENEVHTGLARAIDALWQSIRGGH